MVYTIYFEELKQVICTENLTKVKHWIATHGWVYFPGIENILLGLTNQELVQYIQELINKS